MGNIEFEELVISTLGHWEKENCIPRHASERLLEAIKAEGHTQHSGPAGICSAMGLLSEKRYMEALNRLHEIMSALPTDFGTQIEGISSIMSLAIAVDVEAQIDPMMPGLGTLYERLLDLGMVPMRMHPRVVQHYRLAGEPTKADELLGKLRKAAPNIPGLAGAPLAQSKKLDLDTWPGMEGFDGNEQGCDGEQFYARAHEMIDADREIDALMREQKYKEVVDRCKKVVEDVPLSEKNLDYFRYQQAIALDYLGMPLDALEILGELREKWPTHMNYARSMRIVLGNVKSKAEQLLREDPDSGALRNFAEILDRLDYSPFELKIALSLQDAKQGRHAEGKERMVSLVELSPHELDYLGGALKVSEAIGDVKWRSELLSGIQAHLKKYPYLIQHQALLRKYSSSAAEPKARQIVRTAGGRND